VRNYSSPAGLGALTVRTTMKYGLTVEVFPSSMISALRKHPALRSVARQALLLSREVGAEAGYAFRQITSNRDRRRRFQANANTLGGVQGRIVRDLQADGISVVHINDLFPDSDCWASLASSARAFAESREVRERTDSFQAGSSRGDEAGKEFLVRRFSTGATIPFDDPMVRFALASNVLDPINAYLGLMARIHYLDIWYTIPAGKDSPRTYSQNWHRDHEDKKQVKVFLYCSDVDGASGPLQYVRGSSLTCGRYGGLWSRRSQLYPPADAFERVVDKQQIVTCEVPAGTLVFCDTTGFHRGGLATANPRLVMNWIYVTGAAYTPRRTIIQTPTASADLSTAARCALA
jgi:hypothetical protein